MSSATVAVRLAGQVGDFALDVAFEAPLRGVTALFGRSGSGKTTLLRALAGLERLHGRIALGEEVWQDDARGIFRAAHRRAVGFVFQEASLFPHLSVRDNLLYGARRASPDRAPSPSIEFADAVALLGVGHLLERAPAGLSGGERQRVAIGRALLAQPRLLLMDEPLASLDRAAKAELLPYLEALHDRLAIPILYVSHDLGEVERLADTLALLDQGRIRACGPLTELQSDAKLPLVGDPQAAVTLEATLADYDPAYGLASLAVPGGRLIAPLAGGQVGARKRLRIGAADVSLSRTRAHDTSILNRLPARVEAVAPHAPDAVQVNVVLRLGEAGDGARLIARLTRKSVDALQLKPGEPVVAQIKGVAVVRA